MDDFLKILLKTGLSFLNEANDRTASTRARVRDRVDVASDRAARAVSALRGQDSNTAQMVMSFAAGIGLGIGVGLLFAPAAGDETRDALAGKLQDLGDNIRERFSCETS